MTQIDMVSILLDRNDGPINKGNVIFRTIELASKLNKEQRETLAEATFEALDYIGENELSSTEFA